MPKFVDLTGQKFGKLKVLGQAGKDKWGNFRWLCRCECGQEKIICGTDLKSGKTKSCGCLRKEVTIKRSTKNGHNIKIETSRIYDSWRNMIQRCTNPNRNDYKNYGGRGITVCERWSGENGFIHFLEDMGERPKGCSIDRINNNKGYCKENCRWVTPTQQARNTQKNLLQTYRGKTQCLAEWAEECDIPYRTLQARLCQYGWSIEKALTTPVGKYKKRKPS